MILVNTAFLDTKTRELVTKLFKPNSNKSNLIYFLSSEQDIPLIKIEPEQNGWYIFTYPIQNELKQIKCKNIFIICCNGNDDIPDEIEDITEPIIKKKFEDVYTFDEWNLYTKNYLWKWSMIHESINRFMIPEKKYQSIWDYWF